MIFLKIHTGKSEIPCEDNNTWLSVDRFHPMLTAAWLAQLVEHQSVVREVEGSSPRPDQHSGS